MIKIGEINNSTENKLYCMIFGVIINILVGTIIYSINRFDIFLYMTTDNLSQFILFPLVVVFTVVIHECIHIFTFKYFGRGQARIRIRRDKKLGAIVIQQTNSLVYYNKIETLFILLSPLVLITFLSVIFILYNKYPLMVYINCMMNSFGSSIDMYISLRLVMNFPKDIKIQYNNGEEVGMEIYK